MTVSPKIRQGLIAGVVIVVALGLSFFLFSVGDLPTTAGFDDRFCENLLKAPETVVAEDWLKDPYGGTKRLGSLQTDEGLALLHSIMTFGPRQILAVKVHTEKVPTPYQYAEGLLLELPTDPARRRGLFEIYAKFVRREGFSPQADRDQKFLYFPCARP